MNHTAIAVVDNKPPPLLRHSTQAWLADPTLKNLQRILPPPPSITPIVLTAGQCVASFLVTFVSQKNDVRRWTKASVDFFSGGSE